MDESEENLTIPFAAVISCSDLKHEEIISNILGVETLPEPELIAGNINGYPWHLETKYYTADVNIIALKDKNLVSSEFADNTEAVVLHFDSESVDSFKAVKSWLPFLEQFDPQVRLLACNNCSDESSTGLKRQEIIEWCLPNQFELVELNPEEEIDNGELEDDFQETKSYKRIVQALQAHSWCNLIMKDPPIFQPSEELLESIRNDSMRTPHCTEGIQDESATDRSLTENEKDVNKQTGATNGKIDTLFDEDRWLFDAVGNEDPGGESFEALFSQILNMKEKAATLSGNERKQYAEKVTVEFWRALGGNEDEIAGLSSDEN